MTGNTTVSDVVEVLTEVVEDVATTGTGEGAVVGFCEGERETTETTTFGEAVTVCWIVTLDGISDLTLTAWTVLIATGTGVELVLVEELLVAAAPIVPDGLLPIAM